MFISQYDFYIELPFFVVISSVITTFLILFFMYRRHRLLRTRGIVCPLGGLAGLLTLMLIQICSGIGVWGNFQETSFIICYLYVVACMIYGGTSIMALFNLFKLVFI